MVLKWIFLVFKIWIELLKSVFRKFVAPSKKSVNGEIALITGAGHGMGRLFSFRFAALGAKIVVVDVNETGNLETAEMLKESGATVFAYTCDLRNKDEIKRLGRTVRNEVGDVDILVNNAGVLFNIDFLSLSEEMISTTFQVNILSHFWLIREFLPSMQKKNHGHILAMGSSSGRNAAPFFVDYSSSKRAVVGLMEGLQRELRWFGYDGIKTTYANPSFVNTGMANNPTSNSKKLCPVLEPDFVVDKVMEAMLTNQYYIDIPNIGFIDGLMETFLPHEAFELLFDFVKPRTDNLKLKKNQ